MKLLEKFLEYVQFNLEEFLLRAYCVALLAALIGIYVV